MEDPRHLWRGTLLVLASSLAFSTAGLFTRLVDADVWTLLFWRGVFGGLLIAAYVAWRDGSAALPAIRRIGRPGLVAAGCSTAATICFINALRQASVADVMVIVATTPFFAAAMAWAWAGEREKRTTLAASIVALAGVAVMVVPMPGAGSLAGALLAFAMTLLIAAMMVVMRHHRDVCMLPAASLSCFLCALIVWPWARPASVSAGDFAILALFGTVQFGLGQLLLTLGLRSVSATRSALIGALETPLAPALVWLVLGERPAAATLLGGSIVLAAVLWDVFAARYGTRGRDGAAAAKD
jgi:drug/metabolite transporter (DMT)-like permease